LPIFGQTRGYSALKKLGRAFSARENCPDIDRFSVRELASRLSHCAETGPAEQIMATVILTGA
jgi:hypothetical protein